ncbi:hypothetical protein AC244_27495 [Ensifer adhaerens]|uniref:Enoyl reductase (ER) domain-containing protein n=1 Tax=Ensifer adhaerens TaxID=106592 RepID=A0A0L8BIH2_ENSAD|nr:Zn-dependent alcohol dehydrogenase [Ensifer adhaerens]KOF14383.1 hypothetical protein AC244_27495 [Ensifer adhaerens]
MKSKAALLVDYNAPLVIDEVDVQGPKEGEVLVRIKAAGVCHSDLHAINGQYTHNLPLVLGHEGAGIVEDVGQGVTNVRPGDHVVLSWLPSCGKCRPCLRGRPANCEDASWPSAGTLRDGTSRFGKNGKTVFHYGATSTFSELTVVPSQSAVPVARDAPLTALSLIGCAVSTGVGAALNTAKLSPQDRVAVVGCGGVGLNIVQGARIAGAQTIVAVDRSSENLELARRLGATHLVNSEEGDVIANVQAITDGGVDFAFEAVGRRVTIALAMALLARGGRLVLVGMASREEVLGLDVLDTVVREVGVVGCWYGSCDPQRDFPRLVDFYKSGSLKLDEMIEVRPLEDINLAFSNLAKSTGGRTVIAF